MKTEDINVKEDFVSHIGNNVKLLSYNPSSGFWTITYKNNLKPDKVRSADLIDFLRNA